MTFRTLHYYHQCYWYDVIHRERVVVNIMFRVVCRRRVQDPAAVPLPGVCGQQPGGPLGSAQAPAAVQVLLP